MPLSCSRNYMYHMLTFFFLFHYFASKPCIAPSSICMEELGVLTLAGLGLLGSILEVGYTTQYTILHSILFTLLP